MTTTTKVRRKIVFEHDPDPDFSWLEQDCYDPNHPSYAGPVYPTEADAKAGTNAYDPDWYRDPDNHVALAMTVLEMTEEDDDWRVVDSLGGIDFLTSSDDWATGTFYHVSQIPDGYLRELAREASLPE